MLFLTLVFKSIRVCKTGYLSEYILLYNQEFGSFYFQLAANNENENENISKDEINI